MSVNLSLCCSGESSTGLRGTSSEKHLGEALQGKLSAADKVLDSGVDRNFRQGVR